MHANLIAKSVTFIFYVYYTCLKVVHIVIKTYTYRLKKTDKELELQAASCQGSHEIWISGVFMNTINKRSPRLQPLLCYALSVQVQMKGDRIRTLLFPVLTEGFDIGHQCRDWVLFLFPFFNRVLWVSSKWW